MTFRKENAPAAREAESAGRLATLMQSGWMTVALAGLAFAVCCLRSFVFPHTPLLLWGDQLGFATKGSRLLFGELPYRDFFEFVAPGTELAYGALFRCFGISLWLPNLLMAAMAAIAAVWMTWCARRLMRGIFIVLPALLLIGFVLYGSMDATHHWFSTLAVMAAVAALFDETSLKRVALAGAMCGLAASFTQTKGAAIVVALMVYLIWKSARENGGQAQVWRRCLVLCGAALAVFSAINLPLILAAGVGRWFADVIVFPSRYFGSFSTNNWRGTWPEFVERTGVLKWIVFPFMYAAVPLAYAWFFREMSRLRAEKNRDTSWDKLFLLALAGTAMLAAVAPALSIRRISSASPPAMILLIWLLSRSGRWRPALAKALGAVSLAIAVAQIAAIQLRPKQIIDLPVGRVAILDPANYQVYRWMSEHTHPGQWFFGLPPLTLPLGLRNPSPVESVGPGAYTRPEMVAAVVQALKTKPVPLVVMRPDISIRRQQQYTVDYSQPFYDYLHRNYRRTKVFSTGDEVWERKDIPQTEPTP
jgi:hypothetical protein